MQFRSELNIPSFTTGLTHKDKILLIGSCFAQNVGRLLRDVKMDAMINPFGTIYNPVSIEQLISKSLSGQNIENKSFVITGDRYLSLDMHSDIAGRTEAELVEKSHVALKNCGDRLKELDFIFITLGSAMVYYDSSTNHVVANCHKQPNHRFNKKMLTIEEITQSLTRTIGMLCKLRPAIQIVLMISPVRHLREGMVANQHSKARLIEAIHEVVSQSSHVHYFPSYELLLDDLRDYRFYDTDLVHPNNLAIEYIWEKFSDAFFSEKVKKLNQAILKINKALAHRPFYPEGEAHKKFLIHIKAEIAKLQQDYPYINFE